MRASAWPEADALFHRDPRWLGSDDAYSVPLGGGRTLWMFGDTFIGDGANEDRNAAAFIRNSIGIMNGDDPASASISFHWGADGGAFFEVPAPDWLWPLDGVRIGDRLLLFFMLVRPSEKGRTGGVNDWRVQGPLGFFDVYGWTSVLVENPDEEPDAWRWSYVAPLEASPITLGAATLVEDDRLYLFGWDRIKRISVARMSLTDAERARFDALEWWDGSGWSVGGAPATIVGRGHTEFTVHRSGSSLILTAVVGVEPAEIALRTAPAPEGPWSEPARAYTPPENDREDAFVYAGKAHPQLIGADLVTTYASNGPVDVTLSDNSLYYPRFARIWLEEHA